MIFGVPASRSLLHSALIFAAFLVLKPCFATAEHKQIMAVKPGTVFRVSTTTETYVDAYCMESRVTAGATRTDKPKCIYGSVTLHWIDGRKEVTQLSQATEKLLTITGDNGSYCGNSLAFKSHDKKLIQVEFHEPVILSFDDGLAESSLAIYAQHFTAVSLALAKERPTVQAFDNERQYLQFALWRSDLPFTKVESGQNFVDAFKSPRAQDVGSTLRFFRLSTQSDCSLLTTFDGKYVIHDIGATEAEVKRLLEQVRIGEDGKRRIALVITHAHRDHYNGLMFLLKSKDVVIDYILLGLPSENSEILTDDAKNKGRFARLLREVRDLGFEVDKSSKVPVNITLLKGGQDIPGRPLQLLSTHWRSDTLEMIPMEVGDVSMKLYWLHAQKDVESPLKDPHRHNIVALYDCRGTKTLDFGDADERHVYALLERHLWALKQKQVSDQFESTIQERSRQDVAVMGELRKFEKTAIEPPPKGSVEDEDFFKQIKSAYLHVDVLKWPHHAWYPDTAEGQKLMKVLLKMARPREVVIAIKGEVNGGPKAAERVEKIKNLISEVCKEERQRGCALDIEVRTPELADIEYRN